MRALAALRMHRRDQVAPGRVDRGVLVAARPPALRPLGLGGDQVVRAGDLRHRAAQVQLGHLALEGHVPVAVADPLGVVEPGILVGVEELAAGLALGRLALLVERDGEHRAVAAQRREARRVPRRRQRAPAARVRHLGRHLALLQVDDGDRGRGRGVLHQHVAAVGRGGHEVPVVEGLCPLRRQQHLVLERQIVGAVDLQHIRPLAAGGAAEVGGGDIDLVPLRAEGHVADVGRADHAEELAAGRVEHADAAVGDVADGEVRHVDALAVLGVDHRGGRQRWVWRQRLGNRLGGLGSGQGRGAASQPDSAECRGVPDTPRGA